MEGYGVGFDDGVVNGSDDVVGDVWDGREVIDG